ncbi:MAG TPA: hypothetical protein VF263_09150 [Longimicrobiaceae bacterium]
MIQPPPPPTAPAVRSDPLDAVLLRGDPLGAYARSDEETRGEYLRVLRDLARRGGTAPEEVAERVLRKAVKAAADPAAPPAAGHVGYWLVGSGALDFEAGLGLRPGLRGRVRRHPAPSYLALAVGFHAAAAGAVAAGAAAAGTRGWLLAAVTVLALAFMVEPALFVARQLLRPLFPPRMLPRLALPDGIPDELRTLVVVPTLLSGPEDARDQVLLLERMARGHTDPNLRFALLSDFPDAPEQTLPGDATVLAAAEAALAELNARHRDALGDRFFVLHRERRWNAVEGVWMGWERKRGKIDELNRLLREPRADTGYRWRLGGFDALLERGPVRYVITLDEDADLMPGQAVELVRTAAHPLNRPVFDPAAGRVVDGYGILQPVVVGIPPREMRTRYTRLSDGWLMPVLPPLPTGAGAPPPPTHRELLRPDFYFDVFGDARFGGKGLYDVDAFRTSLEGVLPENRILSHDHLEGRYARTGVLSYASIIEAPPVRYATHARRMHRWVRGDVQVLPWLFPRVLDATGARRRNPTDPGGRLRSLYFVARHLKAPSILLFLLLAWTVLPGPALLWTLVPLTGDAHILATMLLRACSRTLAALLPSARARGALQFAAFEWQLLFNQALRVGLVVASFPFHTFVAAHAVATALWRMHVSRRGLLEWTAQRHAETAGGSGDGPTAYLRAMWVSTAWGVGVLAAVAAASPARLPLAAPFCAAWALAFLAAWYVDRPLGAEDPLPAMPALPDLSGFPEPAFAEHGFPGGPPDLAGLPGAPPFPVGGPPPPGMTPPALTPR